MRTVLNSQKIKEFDVDAGTSMSHDKHISNFTSGME